MAGPKEQTESAQALAREFGEELGSRLTAQASLYQDALARRLGLTGTDVRCLDVVFRAGGSGRVTAGRLAESSGLTTGAITGVVDRLERAGFVRREKDPQDRRQVLVRLAPERESELRQLLEPWERGWLELCSVRSEKELRLVRDFVAEAIALFERQTEALRPAPAAEASGRGREIRELSAPLSGVEQGTLEFARGVSELTIDGAAPADLLYKARFESGPVPKISVLDGDVVVEFSRSGFRLFDWKRKAPSTMSLNPAVAWTVAIKGGASRVTADLTALSLQGFQLRGGASDLEIRLPRPEGTVPVRITHGASNVRILRPAGTAARVHVTLGASGLTLDTLRLGAVGGETRWQSPEFDTVVDRYDVELTGGASDMTVATY